MTDNQEKHSIDDLFHQAFEALPPQPGTSGWDKPSDRVWQHLEKQIDTPTKGNNLFGKIVGGVAVLAVAVTAWYYWSQPAPTPVPVKIGIEAPIQAPESAPTVAETPIPGQTNNRLHTVTPKVPTAVVQTPPAEVAPVLTVPATTPPAVPGDGKSQALPVSANTDKAPNVTEQRRIEDLQNGKSRALPGTRDAIAPPNTTERRRVDDLLNGNWRKPLQPLPQRWPKK
jgi:hypothetical protein